MNKHFFDPKTFGSGRLFKFTKPSRPTTPRSKNDKPKVIQIARNEGAVVESQGRKALITLTRNPEANLNQSLNVSSHGQVLTIQLQPSLGVKLEAIRFALGLTDANIANALKVAPNHLEALQGDDRRLQLISDLYELITKNEEKTTYLRFLWKTEESILNELSPQKYLEQNDDTEALSRVIAFMEKTVE